MHVWWHKNVFISITKNAALREEEGHAGRQLQTDVNKLPFLTHRVLRRTAQTVNEEAEGLRLLQWKEICTNKDIHKAMTLFCQLHCIAAEVRALKL